MVIDWLVVFRNSFVRWGEIRSNKLLKSSWITTNHNGRFHHRRQIYDRSAINGLFFYEKIDVVYEDNRGKLRFTIKVKMHLRFTRNGRLRIYEDNKFPFTVYEDNKSAFTVHENTHLAPSVNYSYILSLQNKYEMHLKYFVGNKTCGFPIMITMCLKQFDMSPF